MAQLKVLAGIVACLLGVAVGMSPMNPGVVSVDRFLPPGHRPPPPPPPSTKSQRNASWTYMLTAPDTAYVGSAYVVAVEINNASSPSSVVVSLCQRERSGAWTHPRQLTVEAPFPAGSSSTNLTIEIPDSYIVERYPISYGFCAVGHGGAIFNESKYLSVQKRQPPILIQTDKPTYKASQTVLFRVVCIDDLLRPYVGSLHSVRIKDPQNNELQSWKNITLSTGVFSGEFELSDLPTNGKWKISITTDQSRDYEDSFLVENYVLPKFEVTIDPGKFWLKSSATFGGKIKAKYTFGKPVEGVAEIHLKRRYWRRGGTLSQMAIQLNEQGEGTFQFARDQLFDRLGKYVTQVELQATVTESLTGISLSTTEKKIVQLTDERLRIKFPPSSSSNIKPGLPYRGFLEITLADGSPIEEDMTVLVRSTHVFVTGSFCWDQFPIRRTQSWSEVPRRVRRYVPSYPNSKSPCWPKLDYSRGQDLVLTVQPPGILLFSVPTEKTDTKMVVEASLVSNPKIRAVKNLNQMKSESGQFMHLTLVTQKLRPGSVAAIHAETTEDVPFVHYQLTSRGRLIAKGYMEVANRTGTLRLPVTTEMTPTATLVSFYVRDSDGEIITDSLRFNIDGLFENQVNVSYNASRVEPRDTVTLRVKADLQSLVLMSAVDKSALLLGKGHSFGEEEVARKIGYTDSGPYYGTYYWYPRYLGGTNARDIFQRAGYILFTDALAFSAKIGGTSFSGGSGGISRGRMGAPGAMEDAMMPMSSFSGASGRGPSPSPAADGLVSATTTRSFFPETWLWANATVGSDGVAEITAEVPDSITSWVASAFAMNSQSGMGVSADPAQLEVFRPFFVTANLPTSIIRGEETVILVTVFNYLPDTVRVEVTLKGRPEFVSLVTGGSRLGGPRETQDDVAKYEYALPNRGTAFYFPIAARKIGFVTLNFHARSPMAADRVERQLRVEPEGIPQQYFHNLLINLGSSHYNEIVPLSLPPPDFLVPNATRVTVALSGDILGDASSLRKLVRLPTGCGEQNLGKLAPLVLVSEYLKITGQMTPELERRANDFIKRGYQRQLYFQNYAGYFSVFPSSPSNLRLTAFAMKTFQWIRNYTYVDPRVVRRGLRWLTREQAPDGSFTDRTTFRRSFLTPDTYDDRTFADTSYVLISLLETGSTGDNITDTAVSSAVSKAVNFLERRLRAKSRDPYTLSLMAYALQLANSGSAYTAFNQLRRLPRRTSKSLYWAIPGDDPNIDSGIWTPPYRQRKAIEVETTSYAVLTFLSRNSRSSLRFASLALTWLIDQRNPYGGFVSTQDTVVALQSMVQYASRIGAPSARVRVTSGNFSQAVTVNELNRQTLQVIEVDADQAISTGVRIDGTGLGVLTGQVIVDYYVTEVQTEPTFDLTMTVTNNTLRSFALEVCATYLLNGTSGMAIVELGLPTGYELDRSQLYKYDFISKSEPQYRQVTLYINQMHDGQERCFDVILTRESMVYNSLPVPVSVYAYYEPAQKKTVFYQRQTKLVLCDVCENCTGCQGSGTSRGRWP